MIFIIDIFRYVNITIPIMTQIFSIFLVVHYGNCTSEIIFRWLTLTLWPSYDDNMLFTLANEYRRVSHWEKTNKTSLESLPFLFLCTSTPFTLKVQVYKSSLKSPKVRIHTCIWQTTNTHFLSENIKQIQIIAETIFVMLTHAIYKIIYKTKFTIQF